MNENKAIIAPPKTRGSKIEAPAHNIHVFELHIKIPYSTGEGNDLDLKKLGMRSRIG